MRFFDSTEELRQVETVNPALSFDKWQSNEQKAIKTFFLPVFGRTLVDEMISYKTEIDVDKKKLFTLAAETLGNFILLKYTDKGEVQITDAGITRTESDKAKTAYAQQVRSLKMSLENDGFEAMEDLIDFLYEKEVTFTNWTTAPAYGIRDERIIDNGKDLDAAYKTAQPHRIFLLMRDALASAEELHIANNFQDALVNTLRTATRLSLTGKMKTLRKYVDQVIVCNALIECLQMKLVVVTPEGVKVANTENEQAKTTNVSPSYDNLQTSIPALEKKAANYLSLAKQYVIDNPTDFGATPTVEPYTKTRPWV